MLFLKCSHTGNHHALSDAALPVMLIHAHMIQAASSAIVTAEYRSNYLSIFYRYNTRSWISLKKSKDSLSLVVNRTDSKAVDGLPEAVHLVIIIYRHNPYFIFILITHFIKSSLYFYITISIIMHLSDNYFPIINYYGNIGTILSPSASSKPNNRFIF